MRNTPRYRLKIASKVDEQPLIRALKSESCCARHIEVLRESLGAVRAVLNINSRRKKDRRTHYPMKMERNGEVFVQDVPVEEYIPILPVLYIGLPGYIRDARRHQTGDGSQDATLVGKAVLRSEAQIDELLEKYNATRLNVDYSFSPLDFGKLLAKIAYCAAIERFGLNGIVEAFVVPAILGQSNDIWHFVGCDYKYPYVSHKPEKRKALIWVDLDVIGGVILARIRLFPQADSPVYVIVIGRASEWLRGLLHSIGRRLA